MSCSYFTKQEYDRMFGILNQLDGFLVLIEDDDTKLDTFVEMIKETLKLYEKKCA